MSEMVPALPLIFALDGRDGHNRARDKVRQIAAETDLEAVGLWLAEYAQSPHTLRCYRKEAIRLLLWAARVPGKPLSGLAREDLLAYEDFLSAPSVEWLDPCLPRTGTGRRLFDGPLAPRSVQQAMRILSGLFGYLVAAGFLAGNPLALRRRGRRAKESRKSVERYLDQDLWQSVLDFIESMPQGQLRERQHYERARWLFRLLYGASLRASEAAHARTSDLMQRRGKWWLHVTGKGGREGDVPLSDELIADWARYRLFHGLPAIPSALDDSPLVLSVTGGQDGFLTPTTIYLVVKEVLRRAAAVMEGTDPARAAILRQASTHWLRHTSATHQADAGNDIRFIQKNLRHASIETTAIYFHAEDDRRHEMTTVPRQNRE